MPGCRERLLRKSPVGYQEYQAAESICSGNLQLWHLSWPGTQGEIILGALVRAGFLLCLFLSPPHGAGLLSCRSCWPPTRALALGAECRHPVALPRLTLPGLTPSSLGRGAAHRAEDPLLPVLPL